MVNIGKLTGALVSGVNENTLALANLNFNFAVVQVKPPQEFQGLGDSLSRLRRDKAESGSSHCTARKLGALFEQLVPGIDLLLKAYGTRVSEISTSQENKAKKSGNRSSNAEGAFQHHTGVDGTAIWAAATSGKSAIAMNLLACMLAKVWDADEATAIWAALVQSRRKEIEQNCDGSEPSHIAPLAAAAEAISLKELQEWDASARSWLDIAQSATMRQYKQLEIIVQNLPISVDGDTKAYPSVMRAWKSALTMTENLLRGMPQRVQSGAILLALLSWNIYPDMDVFGATGPKSISQKDELVPPGGRLTVGLEKSSEDMLDGVHWSLYLEHLRYYGDPVLRQRSTGTDTARVTFDEFAIAALGSFLHGWPIKRSELISAATLLTLVWENLVRSCQSGTPYLSTEEVSTITQFLKTKRNWLHTLVLVAINFVDQQDERQKETLKLLEMGFRKGDVFLGRAENRLLAPAFGLLDLANTISILNSDKEKIRLLRHLANERGIRARKAVIRYISTDSETFKYATVFPRFRKPPGDTGSNIDRQPLHALWEEEHSLEKIRQLSSRCQCTNDCSRRCSCRKRGLGCQLYCHSFHATICTNISTNPKISSKSSHLFLDEDEVMLPYVSKHVNMPPKDIDTPHERTWFTWFNAPTRLESSTNADDSETMFLPGHDDRIETASTIEAASDISIDEYMQDAGDMMGGDMTSIFDMDQAMDDWERLKDARTETFHFAIGHEDCAIFITREENEEAPDTLQSTNNLNLDELSNVLKSGDVHGMKLLDHLQNVWPSRGLSGTQTEFERIKNGLIHSMKALASVFEVYKLLGGASVALRAMRMSLGNSYWAMTAAHQHMISMDHFSGYELDRLCAFSCIAMFETGDFDLDPKSLHHVMALASRNSIYTSAALLCDPSDDVPNYEVRHLVGNVGKAGIALMIPPMEPRMMKDDIGHFRIINHDPYDGQERNSLGNLSLHLSFTGYEQNLVANHHGAQVAQVFYLESLISAYDRSRWIADLDILSSFDADSLIKVSEVPCKCTHMSNLPSFPLASIENWEELIDRPDEGGVVRSFKAPFARLAAMSISVQKEYPTVILPEKTCWVCLEGMFQLEPVDELSSCIFIQ